MTSFSQRQGIVRNILQVDEMDSDLRNGLWNILDIYFWSTLRQMSEIHFYKDNEYLDQSDCDDICSLVKELWHDYFGKCIDEFHVESNSHFDDIKDYFLNFQWYEVYDFIEFVANNYPPVERANKFRQRCNQILQKNLSAYRFIDNLISPIISTTEIDEIEEALSNEDRFKPVTDHLKRALELFSDRESPDYRNSIKESISAVESLCILIVGRDKVSTLGKALNAIEKKKNLGLNPRLKAAFEQMYAYTNSEGGIRHALLEETNLDAEEAQFMLVSCSAFINLLKSKADRAGINFSGGLQL
jgi:hypothetical protein